MNVTDYTYLMNKPDAIVEKQAEALSNVLNEFPYFQSARALRLKGLYNENSFKYNYALKVTAAHTTDRSVLFDFITSDEFTAIQHDFYEQKIQNLLDITVIESEIISPQEIRKIAEVKIDPIEQSILTSIKEATAVTFDEAKIEEPKITSALKETEEINKTVEIRIDPIEESIFTSIKESTTVIFEEAKAAEPKTTEKPEETETAKDAEEKPVEQPIITEEPIVVFEELKVAEEPNVIEESVKIAEENLEIGKPLDFSANEKHSFQEWLQLARTEPIDRTEEVITETKSVEKTVETVSEADIIEEEKKKKAEIIDKFIETNPKIPPIKPTAITSTVQLDINKDEDNSYLMTETLARVYLEQKKYTKAIQAYEILILKYPEKITFFADRISDIKILQQNNNNN